jgi:hypothetical protein
MGLGAGALVALCLSAAAAVAQDRPVTTRQDRGDSIKIHASGRLDMDYVIRSEGLAVVAGMQLPPGGGSGFGTNQVEGRVAIRLDAELSEKVSVVVQIARNRDLDPAGVVPFFSGGAVVEPISVREAHMKVSDLFFQGLGLQMGIVNWSWSARGKGGAMVMDPHHAQSLSGGLAAPPRVVGNFQDTTFAMSGRYGTFNSNQMEPLGLHLSYSASSVVLDLVVLPTMVEALGLPAAFDESLYAADLWFKLDEAIGKGSRIGALVALMHIGGATQTTVTDMGVAANLVFAGGFEAFLEGHMQRGPAAPGVHARGHAIQIGGQYTAEGDVPWWAQASYTRYSGDSDLPGPSTFHGSFLSYESVNDFLVVENQFFGLDIDTNFQAFKLLIGLALDAAGGKKNLEFQVGFAYFMATEQIALSFGGGTSDQIGMEIDVKIKWHLNKQVALVLQGGALFDSPILNDMGLISGGGLNAHNSAYVLAFGFDARF